MKKKLFILAVVGLMVCLIGSVAIAGGPSGPAGNSSTGLLYLYEKDPKAFQPTEGKAVPDQAWGTVSLGAWGKMKYNPYHPQKKPAAFQFVFNGHGLESGDYTLIYYPDPWPGGRSEGGVLGGGLMCLGSGTADTNGNLHIEGNYPGLCDLPNPFIDENSPMAKIWLVLSGDVDCDSRMFKSDINGNYFWNPGDYLFESNLIKYNDPVCP